MNAITETDTERTVREEQEAFDTDQRQARALPEQEEPEDDDEPDTAAEAKPDPAGTKLFDASDYEREDLAIAKVDGNQVDRIAIKFTGEVYLDRSSPEDVALYRRMQLGHDVTLQVEGRCNGVGAKGATDREGDLDVVIGRRDVKVHTVYRSTADGITKSGE